VEKTAVQGIAVVHTTLENRDVVARCRQLHLGERQFRFAIKWAPGNAAGRRITPPRS
jgi:hypothetical protein